MSAQALKTTQGFAPFHQNWWAKKPSPAAAIADPDSALDVAAHRLRMAKNAEDKAREARIKAEEAVIAIVGVKIEGTTSIETDFFKVATTGKLTRSLDAKAFDSIKSEIPAPILDRLVKYTPELSLRELRYLESNEPAIYALITQALTIKPAKSSVSVEPLN